jgi:photosystem II stability/assembly factor-like uncharacterized protein
MSYRFVVIIALLSLASVTAYAQDKAKGQKSKGSSTQKKQAKAAEKETQAGKPAGATASDTFAGLRLRSIGPAVTSGRVVDFAVDPRNRAHYFAAAASGGVWETHNGGATWTPVFDNEGSYSIGCVVLDPKDQSVVWVGTGENNSQRSVGYGDGVYKSIDGGKSWANVGLKSSEHIGRIVIDPRNSNTVYVAAQGPLWAPGGDRGLFKTTDGGKTWKKVLSISENSGVTDVVLDPRHPDVLLAASYQRRRHVWTLINGGPECAIYKSTDGGASWNKIKTGLPAGDVGRIGLAVSASKPDVVYAIIESTEAKGGIFRSSDFGTTWEKRNPFDEQAQYYARLFVDPANAERVYVMGVYIQVSDDGAKTLHRLGERFKHVDNHVIWIDPHDTSFYRVGCDGGIYESHDRAANWRFIDNLPVTQFYDVAADNAAPFYHVYGGTQDNYTLGGPARTRTVHGIVNADWFVTQGGDGFHTRADPDDPNTVYAEAQYGVLVRFDRRTGESMGIQPEAGKGEPPLRWNWDSPLLISPHSHTRLYFAANKIFQSDDRGNTWRAISGDLTRQIDRNQLKVMGKVWSVDAVAKNVSTSLYGNIVALAESPKKQGLIYAGTDDGLIQITENGGGQWRKVEHFTGVPERTYVSRILASQHDAATVYASFDNHKNGDFAPYLLKSTDAGKTWTSIKGDLQPNGPVLAIAEDHVDSKLLFVGTEFGLYFTQDGGQKWLRLKGGLPTIAVRDLAIQKQANDLVVGTFGRGIYVLDDYSVLRQARPETLAKESTLFPSTNALLYIPARPLGLRGKGFQGQAYYAAANPPFGAVFTYYLKDEILTARKKRQEAEKEAEKKKQAVAYPAPAQLRAEAESEAPAVVLTIADAAGKVITKVTGPVTKGFHRVSWNLRSPSASLPRTRPPEADDDLFFEVQRGPLVEPGKYQVALMARVDGVERQLAGPLPFSVVLDRAGEKNSGDQELFEFQAKVTRLERAVLGTIEATNALTTRLAQDKQALDQTPSIEKKWQAYVRDLEKRTREIHRDLVGDQVMRAHNEGTPPSTVERIEGIVGSQRNSLSAPTQTQREAFRIASEEVTGELARLRQVIEVDLPKLEKVLDAAGAPWTPGRLPQWKEP